MTIAGRFLANIDAFLGRSGLSPSRFGELAVNDCSFVANLRSGRSPRATTIDRVEAWMADYEKDRARGSRRAA